MILVLLKAYLDSGKEMLEYEQIVNIFIGCVQSEDSHIEDLRIFS